ncbi:hypothetical protein [Aliifodinibius sp. S!AR15-10]|uniref:hypothetical protein n=1 Tax=Aliifodinibius sp. S!AR15-10 TaxID=2950437 RepID=UPI00287025AC|nr:hypothetical protein [Aliifodinibius sp. S!AR15-10]
MSTIEALMSDELLLQNEIEKHSFIFVPLNLIKGFPCLRQRVFVEGGDRGGSPNG